MKRPSPLWLSQWLQQRRPTGYLGLALLAAFAIDIFDQTISTFTLSGVSAATVTCASCLATVAGICVVYWSLQIRVRQRRTIAIRLGNDPNTGECAVRIPYYAPLAIALWVALLAGMAALAATATTQIADALSTPLDVLALVEGVMLAGLSSVIAMFFAECLCHKRLTGCGLTLAPGGVWRRTMFSEMWIPWDIIQEIHAVPDSNYQAIGIRCVPGNVLTRRIRQTNANARWRIMHARPLDKSTVSIRAVRLGADPALTLRALRFCHHHAPRRIELTSQAGVNRLRDGDGLDLTAKNDDRGQRGSPCLIQHRQFGWMLPPTGETPALSPGW